MDVRSVLDTRLADFFLSRSRFARVLGVSTSTVTLVLNGQRGLSLSRFLRWCDVLALRVVVVAPDGSENTLNDWVRSSAALQKRTALVQAFVDDLAARGFVVRPVGVPAAERGPEWRNLVP